MADNPTFLLTGTYSSANKGDAAMQLATAQALRRAWPAARIVISAPFSGADRDFYHDVEVVPASRRRLIFGTLKVACAFIRRLFRSAGVTLPGADAELRAFEEADLVIDLSGDMLTEDYGPHVTYSHFLPFFLAFAANRPILALAQSIGPFRWTRPLAAFVLSRVDAISARDEITLGLLADAGLERGDIELTADMAFLLEPAPAPVVEAKLALDEVRWPDGPVLGVSVSGLIRSHYRKAHPDTADGAFAAELARVLDRAADELGASIVFVSHVTGPKPAKDDRRAAEEVRGAMAWPERSLVLPGDYRPDELKTIISRCFVFMGARMHANIAALSTAVPVVALEYSHKTPGILRLFGQEEASCPISSFDAEEVFAKLEQTWQRRDAISSRLEESLGAVKARAAANVDLVRRVLDQRRRR